MEVVSGEGSVGRGCVVNWTSGGSISQYWFSSWLSSRSCDILLNICSHGLKKWGGERGGYRWDISD